MNKDLLRNRKFHLLKALLENTNANVTSSSPLNDNDEFGDEEFNSKNNDSLSFYFGKLKSRRSMVPDEEIFGVLLLICGLAAALANALILIIAVKHLRSRNVLFIIITNFALIDEFKALCAVYMGAAQLFSVAFMKLDQASIYKMLQISVFIFYFGNICSVLNLILAVTNEFLYIKLPLQYTKFVQKRRVVIAVVMIWLLGLAFSLSKALHGGSNETGAQVWISHHNFNNNETVTSLISNRTHSTSSTYSSPDGSPPKKVYRRPNAVVTDIYALILVSVLIFCLFIVGAIYLSLYRIIRQATCYRSDSDRKPVQQPPANQHQQLLRKISIESFRCSGSDYGSSNYFSSGGMSSVNMDERQSLRHKSPGSKRRKCVKGRLSLDGVFSRTNNHNTVTALNNSHHPSEQPVLLYSSGVGRSTTFTMPSHCKHRRRDSRLFKRHKCVIVILSVCCLYLVYLSCYFSLQLFHVIHIVKGVDQTKLRERYIINFVLRALFVLHASLNPLIFFRIQTFRASFLRFCNAFTLTCGKVGQTPRAGSHSFAEISVPIMEP